MYVRVLVSESYQLVIYQLAIKSSVKRTCPRGKKLAKWIYDSENVSCGGGVFSYTLGRYGRWQMNPSCPHFRGQVEKNEFSIEIQYFFFHRCHPRDPNFVNR